MLIQVSVIHLVTEKIAYRQFVKQAAKRRSPIFLPSHNGKFSIDLMTIVVVRLQSLRPAAGTFAKLDLDALHSSRTHTAPAQRDYHTIYALDPSSRG